MNKLNSNKSGIIFFGAVITLFVFQFVVMAFDIKEELQLWIFAFGSQLIFGGAVVIGCALYKINFVEISGLKRGLSILQCVFVVIIAVCSIAAFLPLATLVQKLLRYIGYNYTPQYGDYVSNNKLFVLGILGIVLFPAIGEELLFRANMVSGFKNRSYGFAIIMSSLMFALMHGSPIQFVHQFLIGMVMAYLFLITRSFYATFIFHFTNNIVAISINLLSARTQVGKNLESLLAMQTKSSIIYMIIVSIIGFVLLVLMLVLFAKVAIKKREQVEGMPFAEVAKSLDDKKVNAFFGYFDRDNKNNMLADSGGLGEFEPSNIPIKEKDALSGGFFAGLGLILFIWITNLLVVWL